MTVTQIKKTFCYKLIVENGQLISDIPNLDPTKKYEIQFFYRGNDGISKLMFVREDYFTPKHFLVDVGIVISDIVKMLSAKLEKANFVIGINYLEVV